MQQENMSETEKVLRFLRRLYVTEHSTNPKILVLSVNLFKRLFGEVEYHRYQADGPQDVEQLSRQRDPGCTFEGTKILIDQDAVVKVKAVFY